VRDRLARAASASLADSVGEDDDDDDALAVNVLP